MEEEEDPWGWTRRGVLVWSGCQSFSSGLEMEASDEEQGQEAWVAPHFDLLGLWWVWGSEWELGIKTSERVHQQVENNKPGEED